MPWIKVRILTVFGLSGGAFQLNFLAWRQPVIVPLTIGLGAVQVFMATQANRADPTHRLNGRLTEVALGYQQMLEENPRHPQALVGMSLVALAGKQAEAAVKMASAAVDAAPGMGTAWVALGQALKAMRQVEKAEQAYEQAIQLDGMNELARLGRGELRIGSGRVEEAAVEFELALRRSPALVAAHLGLGNALAVMGRYEEALDRYQNTLSLRPRLPEAEFAAGFVLGRLGRLKEAETRYRRALVERPDFAAAWMNLGVLLREQGREFYAEAALRRAVELRPDLIAGWINLAMVERDRHRPEEAEAHLRKAFALNPEQVETHIAWCQFRAAEKDMAGAWAWLRWAQARDPEQPEAVNMEGILLHTEGRIAEALAAFERAEGLGHRAAASNRGNALLDMGRMPDALRAHERAVELDPTHPGALYNLALTELRMGDWEHGWPRYEARWLFREVHRMPRAFCQPRWQGEYLDGRRILLHSEQGLGDTIQFCRYATMVASRGGTLVLQVQAPLDRLMRSLPVVQTGCAEMAFARGELPRFDIECPLMSLPAVFGTTVDNVPWEGPYLGTDRELARTKRKQTPPVRPREVRDDKCPRVGFAWAGNPRYKADSQRSLALDTLVPLLHSPGINWISLQKGPAAEQLLALDGKIFIWDAGSNDADLADTAAMMATLDLVITTDTCIAHLAGAMGKTVWILLPHLSDWRWMEETETSPWYPTAQLVRQTSPGDWDELIERVIADLEVYRLRFAGLPCRAGVAAPESCTGLLDSLTVKI
jgi:tetratricopeptide (TPR) repeat protein